MSFASEIAGRMMKLPVPQTRDVVVERDIAVPMEDGARLLADRWYARNSESDLPTLLVRSPYGRAGAFGLLFGRLFAERGFQVVIQSVRGTFGSEGDFNPFDERADGLATIAWLETQPWHTKGRLGMTGPSYLGLTQWAVARDANGSLGALTPQVTASQFHSQAYGGGGVSLDTALSWLLIIGLQERRFGLARIPFALRRRLPPLFEHMPLGELDEMLGTGQVAYFQEWLEHSAADDPYWARRDNSAGIADVQAPVQLVGGWYDIFLPWLLDDYVALREAGREPQLIVGPWAHTSAGLAADGV
jgi:putative CocE/NonD family hydrolase